MTMSKTCCHLTNGSATITIVAGSSLRVRAHVCLLETLCHRLKLLGPSHVFVSLSLIDVITEHETSMRSESEHGVEHEHRVRLYNLGPWGRGYKTVLSTPCSNSMLKPRFHTVLNAQRRSPNFLSTVSYSDLSTERPNPEYAQDHAQRRTQANKDGSSR